MYKKTLLARFQMVYLNASWIDTVEKLWPFENFEHKNYENGYTIRANTLISDNHFSFFLSFLFVFLAFLFVRNVT